MYCFCFVLLCIWGQFSKYKPRGAYIWRSNLTEGFLRYRFGGLIFGGAYTWRGLFSKFYGMSTNLPTGGPHRCNRAFWKNCIVGKIIQNGGQRTKSLFKNMWLFFVASVQLVSLCWTPCTNIKAVEYLKEKPLQILEGFLKSFCLIDHFPVLCKLKT